jgi:hypothetical protein
MSIKKLFESADKSRNYLAETNEKDAFSSVESSKNVEQIAIKQNTFVPNIDYRYPENFAKFGSAYYYYSGALGRLVDYYPYDGSDSEQNEFYNKSLDVEKYIFNNLFPRVNGYANFDSSSYIDLKGGPHGTTYIKVSELFNNPLDSKRQTANVYDKNIYQTAGLPDSYGTGSRESNLRTNFDSGVTVEFWLKAKDLATNANSIVFDMWNNNASGSHDMGRMTIEVLSASATSPFLFTVQSGSMSSGTPGSGTLFRQAIGQTITSTTLDTWNHYAFVFQNSGSDFKTSFYLNGYHNHTVINTDLAIGELPSKDMKARIGALIAAPFRSDAAASTRTANTHTLTGSIDELRFWKVARNPEQIGVNWFTQVRGGTNTDISNTTLGVYYKFNEGNSGFGYLDNNVLDYSGRLTNGTWTGTPSRTLSSAIVEASAASSEYKDPIIYSNHPDVVSLRKGLFSSGSYHDKNNTSNLKTLMPSWILEEHEQLGNKNPELIAHIVGTYFDKIYCQIESLTEFKKPQYTSASAVPLPFAEHLPQSLGLYTPQLFVDSDVVARFLNKTEDFQFENDLTETKNLIYLNLYNNLTNIYKTKGTEKAIKNVFRCFNLDDSIVKLKTYVDNDVFTLDSRLPRLEQVLTSKKALFFNTSSHINAVCYQFKDPDDTTGTRGFISGSGVGGYENKYGFTAEADFTLPTFDIDYDSVNRDFRVSSIFGMYTASAAPESSDTLTWPAYDGGNFQVYAVRETKHSKNVFFMLSSSYVPQTIPSNMPTGSGLYVPGTTQGPFPLLTSSIYFDAYDNSDWNLSVRLKPSNYPYAEILSGSDVFDTYDLVFQGLNTKLGTIENSFTVSASISKSTAQDFLSGSKRMYAGANRTDFTGDVRFKTDIRLFNTRYWAKYLDEDSIKQHIYDLDNSGISGSFANISPLDPNNDGYDILNRNLLVLDWNFSDVTGSDSSGNFLTQDMSSGSAQIRRAYGWVGGLSGYKHPGKGHGFKANSTSVSKEYNINSFKFIEPEAPISSDSINILTRDDELYGFPQTIPNFHYSLEKSLQAAISDEILNFFAGAIDFNNLIGEPVNRYRSRYKKIEKLREAFFRRVTKTTQVEDYVQYYQWFDDSLSEVIGQLMPASGRFSDDVFNVVESHVLERNKYKSQFPTIEFKLDDPITPILGINERLYNWKFNHAPLSMSNGGNPELGIEPGVGGPLTGSELQKVNSRWWKDRAERRGSHISSGNNDIDNERDNIRQSIENDNNQKLNILTTLTNGVHSGSSYVLRKLSKPYRFYAYRTASPIIPIRGGVNFEQHKKIDLTYNSLRPAGPINEEGGVYVPENVLLGDLFDSATGKEIDTVKLRDSSDPDYDPHFSTKPNAKVYRRAKIQHGRNWEEGIGYQSAKSDVGFPFNIVSSSVKTGYNKLVDDRVMSGVMITNLHNDVYGPDMESPMQGPFTNYAVGGHQSRHVRLNKLADNSTHPTGSVSMNSVPSAGDTLVLHDGSRSVTFTFRSTTSDPEDVGISGTPLQTMLNLVAVINSYPNFKIRALTTSNASASLTNVVDYKVGPLGITTTGDWPYEILGMAGGSGGFNQWDSRPEAWKILLGKCDDPLKIGAIGMVGPDYPQANASGTLLPVPPYPSTASQKAVYYRDFVAKRPVNIRNIRHTTGSTILGNYEHNYQIVQAPGGYSNPRQFIERQPNLPALAFSASSDPNYTRALTSSTSIRTLLDIHRGARDGVFNVQTASALVLSGRPAHFDFSADYSTDYLQGGIGYATQPLGGQAITNNSVITSKFSAPGGIEVMSRGYQDFRAGEFSVYNMLNNRNLTVRRPFQNQPGLSGSHPTATVAMNKLPTDGDTITFPDGDTTRTFTFKNTVVDPTLQMEINGDTITTMENFVSVVNAQKDFYIRGSTVNATASFVNIKHYVKGNGTVGLTLNGDAWGYSITTFSGGTDGPEVDGIRVFDIHGNDYGLTMHAARPTARFFRDSVMRPTNQGATYNEAPAFHRVHRNNIPRPKIASETFYAVVGGPQNYNEKAAYFIEPENYSSMLLSNETNGDAANGVASRFLSASRPSGFTYSGWIRLDPSTTRDNNGNAYLFGVGKAAGSSEPFVEISKTSASFAVEISSRTAANFSGNSRRAEWNISTVGDNNATAQVDELNLGNWVHLVVSVPVSAAFPGPAAPSVYINGVAQPVSEDTSPYNFWDAKQNTGTTNILGAVPRDGTSSFAFGRNPAKVASGLAQFGTSGAMDQISIWTTALSASEVTELYNSGVPCDVTSSAAYQNSASHLFAWYKIGEESPHGNVDTVNTTNTKAFNSSSNAIYNFVRDEHHLFALSNNQQNSQGIVLTSDAQYPTPLQGCVPTLLGYSSSITFETCGQVRDNLNYYHQIPRSDRQYAWMTGAIADPDPCNLRYAGYMPIFGNHAGLFYSHTASTVGDFETWMTMITASDYGLYLNNAGTRHIFGSTKLQSETSNIYGKRGWIPVDFAGLNTIIYEPITSSTNTLGYPLNVKFPTASTYRDAGEHRNAQPWPDGRYYSEFVDATSGDTEPGMGTPAVGFNALMLHRNGPYGYGTHAQVRRNPNHPVLRNERSSSEISVLTFAEHDVLDMTDFGAFPTGEVKRTWDITNFTLPPVSMRGRPAFLNYTSLSDIDDCGSPSGLLPATTTLKITDNNQKTYFNSFGLNTHTNIDPQDVLTPLDYTLAAMTPSDGESIADVNYLIYSENVFPSVRMEFVSSSRRRTNFNNLFWRDSRDDRTALGATVDTAFKVYINNPGVHPSQSCWPLDAQEDFLTRTASVVDGDARPGYVDSVDVLGVDVPVGDFKSLFSGSYLVFNGKAGELQNNYTQYHFDRCMTGSWRNGWFSYQTVGVQNVPGPLYARKQMFAGLKSVTTGLVGMQIPETGSYSEPSVKTEEWNNNQQFNRQIQTASGEALWEAGTQAGIVSSSRVVEGLGIFTHEFKSYESRPWYDNYNDFREQIRLLAKDYAIVPEFRIHNIVRDLVELGPKNIQTVYEIPGTGFFDSTSSFFRDYSNTEKMSYFRDVNDKTSMEPKEFRITVSAVKKFNPYKGFYPAQRTIDLVSQFKDSYFENIETHSQRVTDTNTYATTIDNFGNFFNNNLSVTRPVLTPLFAPGILFNSIKSGMAVDFPILEAAVTKPNMKSSFSITGAVYGSLHAYAGFANAANTTSSRGGQGWKMESYISNFTASQIDGSKWDGDAFWDKRLPFETILDPASQMLNLDLSDLEVSPSSSIPYTASLTADGDPMYKLMARNFFGETANFFLRGGDFCSIKSQTVPEAGIMFTSGTYWGARIKMRRSMRDSRYYFNEWDSGGYRRSLPNQGGFKGGSLPLSAALSSAFGSTGGRRMLHNSGTSSPGLQFSGQEYPLPQDPAHHSGTNESFTMYSRTTAFGPPVAGRHPGGMEDWGQDSNVVNQGRAAQKRACAESVSGALDCFTGHNWSFTPPYYHGEAWCDVLFFPDETRRWKLDEILNGLETVYWRVDAGPEVLREQYDPKSGTDRTIRTPAFVPDYFANVVRHAVLTGDTSYVGGGRNVNKIAMQLSSSVNLFGINRISQNTFGSAGQLLDTVNITNGMEWVIKPKWESPHLNFNSPIKRTSAASGTLTIPQNFGSGTVPRGMWHQFGIIDPDPKKGIFLEINDIPKGWLANHYKVVNEDSVYNKYNSGFVTDPASHGNSIKNKMNSLTNMFGFNTTGHRRKLGQLATNRTISEAVVVIPYIFPTTLNEPLASHPELVADDSLRNKQFFGISEDKVMAALSANALTTEGTSLGTSGESVRKLIRKMDKYILPPEFDFMRNPLARPIVMYIFEFKHTFDKDDLSYIWQNLAPRNYKNIEFEEQSIAHSLTDSELLDKIDLFEPVKPQDIRFMTFKVKQKAVGDYYKHVLEQATPSGTGLQYIGPNAVRQVGSSPFTRHTGLGIQIDSTDDGYQPSLASIGGGGSGRGTTVEMADPSFNPGGNTIEDLVPGSLQPATPPTQLYEAQYNWPYDYLSIVEAIKIDIDVLFDDESNRGKSIIIEDKAVPGYTPPGSLLDPIDPYSGLTPADPIDLLGGGGPQIMGPARSTVRVPQGSKEKLDAIFNRIEPPIFPIPNS